MATRQSRWVAVFSGKFPQACIDSAAESGKEAIRA
jgi:hypothetical protein